MKVISLLALMKLPLTKANYSFRKKDKTWTQPINLGPEINNGKAHRFGQYVTSDEKYLFYTWGTNEKNSAVYWVRFDHLLEKLKQQAKE